MEDLRWILLLVGALVIVAVYFSSRFEREDWVREREAFDAQKKPAKKKRPKAKPASRPEPVQKDTPVVPPDVPPDVPPNAPPKPRIEPQMSEPAVDATAGSAEPASFSSRPVSSQEGGTFFPGMGSIEKPDSVPNKKPELSEAEAAPHAPSEITEESNSLTSGDSVGQESERQKKDEQEESEQEIARQKEQKKENTSAASEIPNGVVLTEEAVSQVEDAPVDEAIEEASFEPVEGVPASSFHSGIEDEITSFSIPADLAIAEAELHQEKQHHDKPKPKTDDTALPSNIEPLVLVLTIMSEDEPFTGVAVKEALEAEGLQHGEMRIFHCFDENLDSEVAETDRDAMMSVFSVASLVEPGYFELEKIKEMEIPGLTLFCQLPGPMPGEDAFSVMLDKSRGVAVRLHGVLCDDKRNKFTTQAKTHYQDRIATFSRALSVARKKADD